MLDDICTLCLEVMVYIKHMQKSEVVRLKKLIQFNLETHHCSYDEGDIEHGNFSNRICRVFNNIRKELDIRNR